MRRPSRSRLAAAALLAVCAGPVGCVSLGEWDFSRKPTIGQQLLDLKAARDGGAVSPEEYTVKRLEMLHPDGSGSARVY
ncbi:MAG: hypothetical protein AAF907_10165 [Planctomycetota bacterium]